MTYSPPYALAQVSVNGGAPSPGGGPGAGVVIPASATIAFTGVDTTGWVTALWELYDYPPGWSVPSGWTRIAATGVVQFSGTSLTPNPPVWTAPTISGWGKWGLRLTVNNATDPQGAVNFPRMVDTSLALTMYSLHGFHDGLAGEQSQFIAASPAPNRQWAEDYKLNVRTMESLAASGGSISPTQGAVALTGGVLNSDVAVSGLTSIRFTGCTAGTSLGGLNIAPTPVPGVPFDVEFDGPMTIVNLDPSSSTGYQIVTGTSSDVLLPPGQSPRARFVRTVVSGVSTYNLYSTGVHQVSEIDARNFGAQGDGVTDDTAAIQAAVNFLQYVNDPFGTGQTFGGGRVYFPAGTYLISSEILIPEYLSIVLCGAGRNASIVMQTVWGNCGIHYTRDPQGSGYTAPGAIEHLTIAMSQTLPLWAAWANYPRRPSTLVTLNQLSMAPGPSPRLLKCTTAGTTGVFPPFGQLWSGNPSAPTLNPNAGPVDPIATITGTPNRWFKMCQVQIVTGGVLGTMTFQYTFDEVNFSTLTTTTIGVTTYALTDPLTAGPSGLSVVFGVSPANYPALRYYGSPSQWQGFSTIVGDVIADGTAQWTVMDGGVGVLNEGASETALRDCNIIGWMTGVVQDLSEIVWMDNLQLSCANAYWCVAGNERRSAATDTPIPGGNTNAIQLSNVAINAQTMGIADSGGAQHIYEHINWEGPTFGWSAWTVGVTLLEASGFETEGAPAGWYVGGLSPFTGAVVGGGQFYNLHDVAIIPEGGDGPVGWTLAGGVSPPAVTMSGIPVTSRLELGIVIEITTGGTLASTNVRFKWSQDGGATFTSGVTASATVALGATGVTAHFPSGTYATSNIYLTLGRHQACFEASKYYASVNSFKLAHSDCANPGTYGFLFSNYMGGLDLEDNSYDHPATFLDNTAAYLAYPSPQPGEMLHWKQAYGSGAKAGYGMNCLPGVWGLDLFCQLATRSLSITTLTKNATHTNDDVVNPGVAVIEVSNTLGPFTITGIAGGTEGQLLDIVNLSRLDGGGPYQMTISNESASSTAANRINVPTGADYVMTPAASGFDIVKLRYSATASRWLMI
jgi:hypothetical protein